MRSVTIEWEGPFSIDEVLGLDNRGKDYGLYQIYGPDSLLYIGETGKTFSQRFDEHLAWLEEEEEEGVGRIVGEWCDEQVRKDTEALTINWHSPAYNSSNIDTYNGQLLKVVSRGKRRDLEAECISDKS